MKIALQKIWHRFIINKFIILILIISPANAKILIKSIDVTNNEHENFLSISVTEKPTYYWFINKSQYFVLDIHNAVYHHIEHNLSIKKFSCYRINKDTVRIKFKLINQIKPQVLLKKNSQKNQYQIEIFFPHTKSSITLPYIGRKAVVIIDPGHGGKDPGAIGYHHIKEKKVVLSIAKKLANLLNKESTIKAILTRQNDKFVTLRGRTAKARNEKADMLISIHANALHTKRTRGVMLFALSLHGASSEIGRWLAQKENNNSLIGGINGINLNNKSNELTKILLDLSIDNTIAQSMELGKSITHALQRAKIKLHTKKLEKASFIVLKSPDIPSVLIECGFLTTPADAKLLNSNLYDLRLAHALKNGIINYLNRYPPAGSLIEIKKNQQLITKYKVLLGDTLISIAKKFNLSITKLCKLNNFKPSHIIHAGEFINVMHY